jgi:hypothetical protein
MAAPKFIVIVFRFIVLFIDGFILGSAGFATCFTGQAAVPWPLSRMVVMVTGCRPRCKSKPPRHPVWLCSGWRGDRIGHLLVMHEASGH